MNFVFVIPPSPFLLDDRAFPFLGPLQIGALARQLGHEVAVADLTGYKQRHPDVVHASYDDVMQEASQQLFALIRDSKAHVVGFYSLAAQHPQVVKLNNMVRERFPNVITVLGGPHANTAPARCLDDAFDYIVVSDQGGGGGEPGFIELIKRIESNSFARLYENPTFRRDRNLLKVLRDNCDATDYSSNPRIIKVPSRLPKEEAGHLTRNGVIYQNDRWPLPARDLIDLKSYNYIIGGERATSIVSATGCPYACTYSLTGDAMVFTDRGFERLDSFMQGPSAVEPCKHGSFIKTHQIDRNVATREGMSKATVAMDEGIRPVFRVTAENGMDVKATAEHPFLIAENEQLVWRRVDELKVGDLLAFKTPTRKWTDQYLSVPNLEPSERACKTEGLNLSEHVIRRNEVTLPTKFTEDLSWLVGFTIGDGCIPKDGRPAIQFCVTERVEKKLKRVVKELFGVELSINIPKHTHKMINGWIYSRKVREYFVQCLGVDPEDKLKVPQLVISSPNKAVVKAFVDGLMDADGYFPKDRPPALTTVSQRLAKDVALLLTMLGEIPSIQKVKRHHATPQSLHDNHYRVTTFTNDRIPTSKAIYKSNKSNNWHWRTPRSKRFLGTRKRTLIKSGLQHPLNIDGYHFLRIESIDAGICEPVYDIKVPGSHSFIANGFVAHNCSHWEGYRKLEAKSSEKVREEIRSIRDAYGIRAFMFYDDEINLRPDFESEFLSMLKEEGVIWRAFFKNGKNLTTEAIFKKMAESGCVQMCTGAESADPKILKDIRKGATVEDNTAFVRLCVKYGIKPKVFTQVGLPGETPETIETLRAWLVQMASEGLDDADVSITTPYEGTPIFESPEKHNIKYNKEELDYSKDVVLYKGVPGEYKSFVWHDRLSQNDLVAARQHVEDAFRKAAGLKPLLAKDDG